MWFFTTSVRTDFNIHLFNFLFDYLFFIYVRSVLPGCFIFIFPLSLCSLYSFFIDS